MKTDTFVQPVYQKYAVKKQLRVKSFISAFDANRDANFHFKGEMHNFWELMYVVHGIVGSTGDNNIYEITGGQVVFHKPMEFHSHYATHETGSRIIIIAFEAQGAFMSDFKDKVFQIDEQGEQMLLEIVSLAGKHIGAETPTDERNLQLNLAGICLERFLLHLLMKPTIATIRQTPMFANYRQIIEVLNTHINENLSLEEIAHLCNMSKSNLKKTFNKYSGTGVMSYFNIMKIKKATQLLKDGVPIARISELLSFTCQNYFSTAFKRVMGCSPRAYLKSLDSGGNPSHMFPQEE